MPKLPTTGTDRGAETGETSKIRLVSYYAKRYASISNGASVAFHGFKVELENFWLETLHVMKASHHRKIIDALFGNGKCFHIRSPCQATLGYLGTITSSDNSSRNNSRKMTSVS